MQPDFNIGQIKLVVGLGNPGKDYENTYHNAGFLFIDYLKKKKPAISNFQFLISKSDTFMNESGSFVKGLMKKRGARLGEILVVHDDSDLNLGKYKIVFGRGPAGHKGAESIIKALGAKDFWRLRIGVRKAGLPAVARRAKAGDFVLKKISPKNKKSLEAAFDDALQLLTALPQPRSSN